MRIEIARFLDEDCASCAAGFLRLHRMSVAQLNCEGYKSPAYTKLLVKQDQAPRAYALLQRAYAGEFADGYPGGSDEKSQAAIALTRALHGSGYKGADPAWLDILPIFGVASGLVLMVVFATVSRAITGWIESVF